jgi:WD40 repeat protein
MIKFYLLWKLKHINTRNTMKLKYFSLILIFLSLTAHAAQKIASSHKNSEILALTDILPINTVQQLVMGYLDHYENVQTVSHTSNYNSTILSHVNGQYIIESVGERLSLISIQKLKKNSAEVTHRFYAPGHDNNNVKALAISADGLYIALLCNSLRIYKLIDNTYIEIGKFTNILPNVYLAIPQLIFLTNNKLIIFSDNLKILYSLTYNTCTSIDIANDQYCKKITLSDDGQIMLWWHDFSHSDTINILKLVDGKYIPVISDFKFNDKVVIAKASPHGKYFASVLSEMGTIRELPIIKIWHIKDNKIEILQEIRGLNADAFVKKIRDIRFLDESHLAIALDYTIQIWKLSPHNTFEFDHEFNIYPYVDGTNGPTNLYLSCDNNIIATFQRHIIAFQNQKMQLEAHTESH